MNWCGFFCFYYDVPVSWTASDPNGDADIESVTIRVMNERQFDPDEELTSTTVTSGDLTDRAVTLTAFGDVDYVIIEVSDGEETVSRLEYT